MKKIIYLLSFLVTGTMLSAQPILYGLNYGGGVYQAGTIYSFDVATNTYTKVYDFHRPVGAYPMGRLVPGADGRLYGMTLQGGQYDRGTIFSLEPKLGKVVKLFDFDHVNGSTPYGSLVAASNGKLYGMTHFGGTTYNRGVLFSYDPSQALYKKILEFNGTDKGGGPQGSLTQAVDGKLYGMTSHGGTHNRGIIFSLDPATETFTRLKDFDNANGANPTGDLLQYSDGKLYGMPWQGGRHDWGVIFSFDPVTNTLAKLFDFDNKNSGWPSMNSLMKAKDGKLYGMTGWGGLSNFGVLFSYDPVTAAYKKIRDFNSAEGSNPLSNLMQASNGLMYGATFTGGPSGHGFIFSLDPETGTYTNLKGFVYSEGAQSTFGAALLEYIPVEICGNGEDDDGNGTVDECGTHWYRDADGDGFGNPAVSTYSNSPVRGYVSNNLDCNDRNRFVGGPEKCDGIDNDCDGVVDDSLELRTFYMDNDQDGWGNAKQTIRACAAPPRYVAKAGDCDDRNAQFYPGAPAECACCCEGRQIVNRFAGTGEPGFYGDGGPATEAWMGHPHAIAIDHSGNIYIGDLGNNRIRKVDTAGIIRTIAGNGQSGFSGDGVPALEASFSSVFGLAADRQGNIYFSDVGNYRVRKIDTKGIITTVAGNGTQGFSGDGGPAVHAQLGGASDVEVDEAGNLYIADTYNYRVRRVDTSGIISTVAGNGQDTYDGIPGPAVDASISTPHGLAIDGKGNLYVATHVSVLKVDLAGTISLVANAFRSPVVAGDYIAAVEAASQGPYGVAVDRDDNVYIGEIYRLRKVDTAGIISNYVATGLDWGPPPGDGGPALDAYVSLVFSIVVDSAGTIYFTDIDYNLVRKVESPLTRFYRDADGDGLGDPHRSTASCTRPRGYAANDDDCNDRNRYQGGTEICDGLDNDCNGIRDDGFTRKRYFRDADGDSWGGKSNVLSGCPPAGYVEKTGDCNDADKAIYPGAAEITNGQDDNCNGLIDESVTSKAAPPQAAEEKSPGLTLLVHPNPSSASFTLRFHSRLKGAVQLRVLDVLGREVEVRRYQPPDGSVVLGDHYRPGIYHVEAVQQKQKVFIRLVKRKE